MLEFYPATHEYRDGKSVIPSVTQTLKLAGIINDRFFSPGAAERGSAVHDFCERYAQGIRTDDIGRSLEGLAYVNAFASWMKKTGAYAVSTETMIDHTIDGFRYCGRYDLLAEIHRKRVLVDIKTGVPTAYHSIQMAAYALAVNPAQCLILYLKDTGKFKERYITPTELLSSIGDFKRAVVWVQLSKKEQATETVRNKSWF